MFCGFVLFDTQLIIERFNNGDNDYIWHSVDLFIDFIAIFKRLLIILASKVETHLYPTPHTHTLTHLQLYTVLCYNLSFFDLFVEIVPMMIYIVLFPSLIRTLIINS